MNESAQQRRRTWWTVTAVLVVLAVVVIAVRWGGGPSDVATTAGAATTPTQTSAPAADSPTTVIVPPPTARPVPAGTSGTLSTPAAGTTVRRCETLRGTVDRPRGTVVITAMRNLDNGDPAWYGEEVYGQPAPGTTGPWFGPQFFGSGNSSVGQRFEVVLALIDDDVALTDDMESDDIGRIVAAGHTLAAASYERVAGIPADECAMP